MLVDADEDLLCEREAGGIGRSWVSLAALCSSVLRSLSTSLILESLASSERGAMPVLPVLLAGGGSGFWPVPARERGLDAFTLLGRSISTQSGSSLISPL